MEFITEKIGKAYYSEGKESEIIDFQWTVFGLKVTISTWLSLEHQIGVEYEFKSFNGFRYLDEGDFLGYWSSSEFNNESHLFRILKGGWKTGEVTQSGLLDVSRAIDELNEYFIATTNGCLTVLAFEMPKITEVELMES